MNFEGFFAHTAVLQALSLAWKINCYFSDRYICTAISDVLRGICRKSSEYSLCTTSVPFPKNISSLCVGHLLLFQNSVRSDLERFNIFETAGA